MNSHLQYDLLLRDIALGGQFRPDRTNTGTYSKFGTQMRFDMADGFPLITTKRVHMKSVVGELLWMLSGSTSAKELREKYGVTIWDEWADDFGELGPVYGWQWVNWGGEAPVAQRTPELPNGVKATYLGVANGSGKEGHSLKKTWEGMIARCYDKSNVGYASYGGRGVSVCNEWLTFDGFAEDAVLLPGYESKLANGEIRYVLDKDTTGSGLLYGPETCAWVTDLENNLAKSKFTYTLEGPDGTLHTFTNPSEFCKEQGIPNGNISDLWTGRKNAKVRHGFRFISKIEIIPTSKGIDQIAQVVKSITEDPWSRRHIVSAWNVSDLKDMALAPCHAFFQFSVQGDPEHRGLPSRLSLSLTQRSADMFLGVPFNIASYALLLEMVAQQTGLLPGDLIWNGGDTHIYSNHIDQVSEQLTRTPRQFPRLELHRADSIFDYKPEDVIIHGYDPDPSIKAPVAV